MNRKGGARNRSVGGLYGSRTKVSPEESRTEIEAMLRRYGADSFGYATDSRTNTARIDFTYRDRPIRFILNLPDPQAPEFTRRETPRSRDCAIRQLWRALVLLIRAKLEAIESGITSFEGAFLADMVLPSGQTFAQWAEPALLSSSGTLPLLSARALEAE